MTVRKSIMLGALAMAAAGAPTAQALEHGLYFEIGLGKSKFKDIDAAGLDLTTRDFFESYDLPVLTLASTLDETDRSYSLTTGYRFNRYLAGEVGYYRLGAAQYFAQGTVDDAGTTLPASFFLGYRIKGISIGGTAALPVGRVVEFRVRGGISNTDTRIKFTATAGSDSLSDKLSDSSQDFYYGAGVGFNFWTYYRLGIDWMKYMEMGKSGTTGATDVDNVQVSFAYQY